MATFVETCNYTDKEITALSSLSEHKNCLFMVMDVHNDHNMELTDDAVEKIPLYVPINISVDGMIKYFREKRKLEVVFLGRFGRNPEFYIKQRIDDEKNI